MYASLICLVSANLLDILLGDPPYRLHPTRLMGVLIQQLQRLLFRFNLKGIFGGLLLVCGTIAASVASAVLLLVATKHFSDAASMVLSIYLLYSSIAFKDMLNHVHRIEKPLKIGNIDAARKNLSNIVGRLTHNLNNEQIAQATIESMSENFPDGWFAPLFYFVVGYHIARSLQVDSLTTATSLAVCYRAINTLDSMVGYKNSHYTRFGKIAARLDDAINYIPSRIASWIICFAAVAGRFDAKGCIKVYLADKHNHPSPNSAHPESAASGALGVKLGGDTVYSEITVKKAHIGAHLRKPGIEDIRRAQRLLIIAWSISIILFCMALIIRISHLL